MTAAAEGCLRDGHPSVSASSGWEQNREGETGEVAVIYDRQDRFLALGLFDAESPLRVRVLHRGKPVVLDAAWWQARFDQALALRQGVVDAGTDGCRLVNGESDGWPGLVLDRYGAVAVLKLLHRGLAARLPAITERIVDTVRPERLVLRLSTRNIQAAARQGGALEDGQLLHGPALEAIPVFRESGLVFEADVLRGQKTGFFLDQRENRRRVGSLAAGRVVLNAFSFSGGFSLYAARGGATAVTDLDLSAHALAAAQHGYRPTQRGRSGRGRLPARDRAGRRLPLSSTAPASRFDLVVLDPPSLASARRSGRGQSRRMAGWRRRVWPDCAPAASWSPPRVRPTFRRGVLRRGPRSGAGLGPGRDRARNHRPCPRPSGDVSGGAVLEVRLPPAGLNSRVAPAAGPRPGTRPQGRMPRGAGDLGRGS